MGRSNIYDVGVNDWDGICHTYENGKRVLNKEYKLWRSMLSRSHSVYTKTQRPTYLDVTCEPSWHSMKKFISDVSTLKGYNKSFSDGWVLDKDILFKGE